MKKLILLIGLCGCATNQNVQDNSYRYYVMDVNGTEPDAIFEDRDKAINYIEEFKEFIKKIFQLSRERGLSARQIAEVMSPEYRDYNGVDMTRNSVIGILNRYSSMFTHIGEKKPKRIKFSSVVEQLEEARQHEK